METLAALVVIGLIVAVARSASRSRPPSPPVRPARPLGSPPPQRTPAAPAETPDDAFAIGYLIGREHGRDDAERHAPVVDDPAHDVADDLHDDVDDGFHDDAGDW